jgi:hypothetical protein
MKSIGRLGRATRIAAFRGCVVALVVTALLPGIRAQTTSTAAANNQAIRPEVRIPVTPLGYLPPGNLPAFYYFAMVELHFIDADHLMFAFNVPRLMKRNDNCPGSNVQRIVHAVVFQLPSGKAIRQADWELYDYMDFLWQLGPGKLLLRRCNQMESIGADLDPQVLIRGTGSVEDVSFSPDRSILVLQERVAPDEEDKRSGDLPSVLAQETQTEHTNVSFIGLNPLHIIGRAEIPSPSIIPVIANGLLEVLTAPNDQWVVKMRAFHGAERPIANIHSLCPPLVQALSNTIFMMTACPKSDQKLIEGYNLQGSQLWSISLQPNQDDTRLITTSTGTHFAIESLRLKHPRAALDPLTKEDIDGEDIDIYDALSGVRIATFQTSPAYTGGQNVDFSPDGARMAVLHDGAIEIYSLNDLVKALPGTAH